MTCDCQGLHGQVAYNKGYHGPFLLITLDKDVHPLEWEPQYFELIRAKQCAQCGHWII